jgi:beta-fructofuranosidase
MHWSLAVLSFVLGSVPSVTAQNSSTQLPDVLTADIVQSLGNNTLFNRWRPTYHFIAPAGWMNVCNIIVNPDWSLTFPGPVCNDV